MKVMSYNSLFGGWDGERDDRHRVQAQVVRALAPDVLLFQEAKHFEAHGWRRLFEVERAFGMRALVAVAPRTGQHTAIFFGPDVEPVGFEVDETHFHHAAAFASLRVPGFLRPITFVSVHLCPLSPQVRLTEASYLLQLAAPDRLTLVAGDLNSLSPHDDEPSDWAALPLHHRSRYFGPAGDSADRRVLQQLQRAGYVDIAHRLGEHGIATVPGAAFTNTEFIPFRSDYFLASPPLAELASSYVVLKDERTDAASDHYPIVSEFHPQVRAIGEPS